MNAVHFFALAVTAAALPHPPAAADPPRPYRLESVDLQDRIIWGVQWPDAAGHGLAFGGQDQDADDGCPHTGLAGGAVKGVGKVTHRVQRAFEANQAKLHVVASRGLLHDAVYEVVADAVHAQFAPPPTPAP